MDYCLAMPLPQFFLFVVEARRLKAMENSVLCDIQAVSICNSEYYKNIKRRFISEFDDSENQLPEQPPIPKGPVLDAASDGAKYSMMSAMALLKGGI